MLNSPTFKINKTEAEIDTEEQTGGHQRGWGGWAGQVKEITLQVIKGISQKNKVCT